jgi:hypothetical protein
VNRTGYRGVRGALDDGECAGAAAGTMCAPLSTFHGWLLAADQPQPCAAAGYMAVWAAAQSAYP